MVVLSNFENPAPPVLIAYYVYDGLLGVEPADWLSRGKQLARMIEQAEEAAKAEAGGGRVPGTQPSHPLADYAGQYEHPGYVAVAVEVAENQLKADYNTEVYPLEHFHYDRFMLVTRRSMGKIPPTFSIDPRGGIGTLSIRWEPAVSDIVFRRVK